MDEQCDGISVGAREVAGAVFLVNVRFSGTKQSTRLGTMGRGKRGQP
jgi:hypothetical protein